MSEWNISSDAKCLRRKLPWRGLVRLFHRPLAQHLPAVRVVQRDCNRNLKNGGNSHRSRESIMQWDTRRSQSIFRSTNHRRVMPANWRPCLIPSDSPIATRLGLFSSLGFCLFTSVLFAWDMSESTSPSVWECFHSHHVPWGVSECMSIHWPPEA